MTLTELLSDLERRRREAERIHATALVVDVLAAVLEDLQSLADGDHAGGAHKEQEPDRLLTAAEAAKRLGVSRRYLYAHRSDFPFARQLPGGTVRFSEHGLARWLSRSPIRADRRAQRDADST